MDDQLTDGRAVDDRPAAGGARRTVTGLLRRASLNLVDQVLSALTNVVLTFIVARAVNAQGYGAFAVGFLIFGLLIGLERSSVGSPLSIRFSAVEGEERARSVGAAIATTLAIGVSGGLLTAVAGLAVGGVLRSTLLAVGIVLPGLILQDACRMVFFAHRRPGLAVLNDLTWAVVQFAVMGVLIARHVDTPWPYVLAWGGAATVAATLGVVQLAARPRLGGVMWWLRGQRDITGYLFIEYLIGASSSQGSILLVGAIGSVSDVGSLRAAQTLLGPIGIVAAALGTFALPEVSRRRDLTRPTRYRIALGLSGGLAVATLAYAGLLLVIPRAVGTELLGDTWSGAHSVLLPMALASTAAGASAGPALIIYGLGLARRTFVLHAIEAPLLLAGMVAGAVLGGTPGAAWGMAAVMTLMIPAWFLQLWLVLRTPQPPAEVPATETETDDLAQSADAVT